MENNIQHNMKKIIILLLVITLLPVSVSAKEKPLSGASSQHVIWNYDKATKTMSFRYDMQTHNANETELNCWRHEAEHVIYEEGMETIGWEIRYFTSCKDIEIPSTIRKVRAWSCAYMHSLESVTLNEGLQVIEDYAFWGSALKTITLPSTVKSIGDYAFYDTKNLQSVVMPISLKRIGKAAFAYSGIRDVTLNDGLESIGDGAFYEAGALREIAIPDSVTELGKSALAVYPDDFYDESNFYDYGGSIVKVTLPANLKKLSADMFVGQRCLKKITLPKNLKIIGMGAFCITGLQEVTIPPNVETLGQKEDDSTDGIFEYCEKLKKVNITTRKLKKVRKGALSTTPKSTVFVVPKGMKKKYTKLLRKGGLSKKVKIKESKKW